MRVKAGEHTPHSIIDRQNRGRRWRMLVYAGARVQRYGVASSKRSGFLSFSSGTLGMGKTAITRVPSPLERTSK
jgi:hypothetical protein